MSNSSPTQNDHLEDIDDGCGCVGVWEAMCEYRADRSVDSSDDERDAEDARTE